jgi:hypothetical protein
MTSRGARAMMACLLWLFAFSLQSVWWSLRLSISPLDSHDATQELYVIADTRYS